MSICSNLVNGFMYACPVGFTGATCETDIDNCRQNPCRHGDKCNNRINNYTCLCSPGYDGKDCELILMNA